MLDITSSDAVVGLLVGGAATLVGKIVWDWLKNGRNGNGKGNESKILADSMNRLASSLEKIQGDTHVMEEVRKDTITTRDDVKTLKTEYENDMRDFKNLVQQSYVINTKMVVLLESVSNRIDKVM